MAKLKGIPDEQLDERIDAVLTLTGKDQLNTSNPNVKLDIDIIS